MEEFFVLDVSSFVAGTVCGAVLAIAVVSSAAATLLLLCRPHHAPYHADVNP